MKQLPIGIQSFEKLRRKNFLYIDKTPLIHRLITESGYYFLSRPRRFGKSLLLSTIKAVFQGKKHLFKNLYIEDKRDWTNVHPVIHISFSGTGYQEVGLENAIHQMLNLVGKEFNIEFTTEGISLQFQELIQTLAQQNQVVLLIDEYDKPLIDYLDKENLHRAKANQKILKSFYSVIKNNDQHIEFVFITGVSKFSKVSIFSDLNNLRDITLNRHYATICGYTQAELEHYFTPYEKNILDYQQISKAELYEKIKLWYNGYSWDKSNRMYNPFSILSFFGDGEFVNFWFATGTPTFLINLLKERFIYDFTEVQTGLSALESYDLDNLNTIPLLFQTGYITLKKWEGYLLTLSYPNQEVKQAMMEHLLGSFSHDYASRSTPMVHRVQTAFLQNQLAQVIEEINHLFATIPNPIFQARSEAYYHSLIHLTFTYLGIYLQSEVNTSRGRCDTVVHTPTHIYILEFKLDKSAAEALTQIETRDYASAFEHQNKTIIKVGINFDSETKKIGEWQAV